MWCHRLVLSFRCSSRFFFFGSVAVARSVPSSFCSVVVVLGPLRCDALLGVARFPQSVAQFPSHVALRPATVSAGIVTFVLSRFLFSHSDDNFQRELFGPHKTKSRAASTAASSSASTNPSQRRAPSSHVVQPQQQQQPSASSSSTSSSFLLVAPSSSTSQQQAQSSVLYVFVFSTCFSMFVLDLLVFFYASSFCAAATATTPTSAPDVACYLFLFFAGRALCQLQQQLQLGYSACVRCAFPFLLFVSSFVQLGCLTHFIACHDHGDRPSL